MSSCHPFLLLFSLLSNDWFCSQKQVSVAAPSDNDTAFVCFHPCLAEDPAIYPGGTTAWQQYLTDSTVYPDIAYRHHTEGVARIAFTISEIGLVTQVRPLNELQDSLTEAAMQVIKTSPKWKPAKQNGRPVPWRMVQQIIFKMEDKELTACDDDSKPAVPIS